MRTERDLIDLCFALIGQRARLSSSERALVASVAESRRVPVSSLDIVDATRATILRGDDPLGDAFMAIRSAESRRAAGAVYTPRTIVRSMVAWLAAQGMPARVVDPGSGSGRFLLAAAETFPSARLVAVETDPLAVLTLRANLAVRGWSRRASIHVADYRSVILPRCRGVTAFVGNPPYVRHHGIDGNWKRWYIARFAERGIRASALAGLHLHFFLKTSLLAQRADVGTFVTSAEWLDVNYGSALRRLFLDGLGGTALHVLEPSVQAFPGTATTAAIACFRVGASTRRVNVRSVPALSGVEGLTQGREVTREELKASSRWSPVVRPADSIPRGDIELGELFRVHRGQVTGANSVWLDGVHAADLPDSVKLPAVTRALDLIRAGARLRSTAGLRRVIDLPLDVGQFTRTERRRIEVFLAWAKEQGADRTYTARHRPAWWSVRLKAPAPVLCTYMARRPPQFTLNACGARHINVAHGLYPRERLSAAALARLVVWLNANVGTADGRTYAGGLTKFEPREVERLRIPRDF